MTIGQNIRAIRKKRGLTQGRLGQLCGMTGGAISSYENGVTVPKRRVVERIAQALDVPADKLTLGAVPALEPAIPAAAQPHPALYHEILTLCPT